jgi:hypothetical protein
MSDREQKLIDAIIGELERQQQETHAEAPYVRVDDDRRSALIDGYVDLQKLVAAIVAAGE